MFALSVHFGRLRLAIDLKNASVNAPLKEDLYVEQLEGLRSSRQGVHAYRLNNVLYGLREA